MEIINLTEEYKRTYFVCLEDWSDEMKEAGNHKENWYKRIKEKGLGVKLALDDNKKCVGMIQYIPIEYSNAEGKDLYFINCIWIHGYEEGIGNHQKKGYGMKLLQAAEEDVKSKGAKGIVAWGLSLPFWMKASWYKKHGYIKVDKDSIAILLWKPFTEDAVAPKWIKQKKNPQKVPGKVTVTIFMNGWCPAQSIVYERAKRAALEFGDDIIFQEIDTFNRETYLEWGIFTGLFIDRKEIRTGPPPSYEDIKKKIAKKVKKLKK
ncbi:MAG: GNAT family N-acetyltransferase [Candidatus Thorarchaeota archaeon]